MRKPEQAPEPSIEEILASIRRIIADDMPAGPADIGGDQRPQPPRQAAPTRARPDPGPRLVVEEEVLELTEDFMLAEEASAVALQEGAEPGEFSGADPYGSGDDDGHYRDPYDERIAPRRSQQAAYSDDLEEQQEAEDETPAADHSEALSAVMAEVRRFSEASKPKETEPAPEPSAPSWGQPDIEALMPQPAQPAVLSRPVWSARHKQNEPAKPAEEAAPAERTPAAAKPSLGGKEDWGKGVQMPVPEGGPAIPFSAEETMDEQPRPARPAAQAERPAHESRPVDVTKTAQAVENLARPSSAQDAPGPVSGANPAPGANPIPGAMHTRAEALADKAVSDFASDTFSAPPVADILKADKPFMEAITSTLVDALSRGAEEPEDFEEAPNLEDFDEGSFSPSELAASARKAGPAMPDIMNLDGGFMASRPVVIKQSEPAGLDQEPPELPREDLDDIAPAEQAPRAEVKAYRPVGIAEPAPMPNVPVAPAWATPGPAAGAVSAREPVAANPERLQPASGSKGLEDTVKELLKPLLMQWLDENMPRIVNEAIREEIAANGLLPRVRDGRR
jgi:cell pole-organizing protein PopZ